MSSGIVKWADLVDIRHEQPWCTDDISMAESYENNFRPALLSSKKTWGGPLYGQRRSHLILHTTVRMSEPSMDPKPQLSCEHLWPGAQPIQGATIKERTLWQEILKSVEIQGITFWGVLQKLTDISCQ